MMSSWAENKSEKIPVELPNGTIIQVEVEQTGQQEVAFDVRPFQEATQAIEGIIEAISETIQKTKPDRASVKFGMELALESGQLTAVLVKGSGKANLEITLEWGSD